MGPLALSTDPYNTNTSNSIQKSYTHKTSNTTYRHQTTTHHHCYNSINFSSAPPQNHSQTQHNMSSLASAYSATENHPGPPVPEPNSSTRTTNQRWNPPTPGTSTVHMCHQHVPPYATPHTEQKHPRSTTSGRFFFLTEVVLQTQHTEPTHCNIL